jgi:hypothetical protein
MRLGAKLQLALMALIPIFSVTREVERYPRTT